MWRSVKMPPLFRGSFPNVGVLIDARLAAMMRSRRSASVSVGTGGDALLLGIGASGSPRAARLAAMYDARSPPIVGGAMDGKGGAGADADRSGVGGGNA